MKRIPPDQDALDVYLAKAPGQRAAISGFVRYLREVHGAKIALPKVDLGRAQLQRRKRLESELLALMKEGGNDNEFKKKWLPVALAYFHGLNKRVGLMVKDADIIQVDGGLAITWNNDVYWLPYEFHAKVTQPT
ncbi:hypothetical protein D3C73_881100 [compost metagenome]